MAQADARFLWAIREATQADAEDLERMRLALQTHFTKANPHLMALSVQRRATLQDFYRSLIDDPQARVLVVHEPSGTQRIGMAVGRIVRHEEFEPTVWGHIEPESRGKSGGRNFASMGKWLHSWQNNGSATVPVWGKEAASK